MPVYLRDIPMQDAQQCLEEALNEAGLWCPLDGETIPLTEEACGRTLSEPIWAKLCSPFYHSSAMDGFAVRAEDTTGATPSKPIILNIGENAVYIDTGDPLPDWANTVIPIELTEAIHHSGSVHDDPRHPDAIRIRAAVPPWSSVRPMGEDLIASQLVLPDGHTLRPFDLGAIAASGHSQVTVHRKPVVAVIPTGDELVPIGKTVEVGNIIEYNSVVLAAQVNGWGGEARRYPITADDIDAITRQVSIAVEETDLVLLNAGSSAGSEDHSSVVIEQLGKVLVHGIAVRPGHPVIFGMVKASNGKPVPVIGVPGYPVSAALTNELFIRPILAKWTGKAIPAPELMEAELTRKVVSPPGDDDYVRVVVGRVGERTLASPLPRGAGIITSLVQADGLLVIPRGVQGLAAGSKVSVRLYRRSVDLGNTIVAIGSHDMTLDILAQHLSSQNRRLVSSNVGSQAGLMALRRREAHFSGCHLLDPGSGQYNRSAIREYVPGLALRRLGWVNRVQGLIVKRGNPKNIHNLKDLLNPNVVFTNRQRGSGTRILLDHHLGMEGIHPSQVKGYEQEEYTHLAVAAAVSSGRADCGLGIAAAANALNLEFVPLFNEEYDLIIPEEYYSSDLLLPLFELANSTEFKKAIDVLPGYDTSPMGLIRN